MSRDSKVIAYHIGLAQTQLARERVPEARRTFERAHELFPRNVPLTIHYAEALLQLGEAQLAHKLLLDLLNNVPPTPERVRLIARAAIEAGDTAEAHYYMAEYSFMTGDLVQGVHFLRQALRVPDIQEIQRIRFEARIDFIREYKADHGYAPSVRDIQLACGISSTSVVDYNLRLLQRDGFIRRSPDISRAIEIIGEEVPVHATAVGKLHLAFAPESVELPPAPWTNTTAGFEGCRRAPTISGV